jgi:nucleolar protein 12
MKRNNSKRPRTSSGVIDPREQSMQGRTGKLLGRAAAAKLKKREPKSPPPTSMKPPEAFAFEGFRASSKQGMTGLKLSGSGKRKEKSRSRSSRRGAAWKASGSKSKTMK